MKNFNKKTLIFAGFLLLSIILVVPVSRVWAYTTPTISINNVDSNGNLQMTIYGDISSPVVIYLSSYNSTQIGYTNNNGYFSTTINYNQYSLSPGTSFYFTVNGIASQPVIWPSYYGYYNNTNNISFSSNNITLSGIGQSTTVTISGGSNNGYYISSGSTVVSSNINGNIITLYANQVGSATITVCSNNTSMCGYLYVNVSNNNYVYNPTYYPVYYHPVYSASLSKNYLTLYSGQNDSINIYGSGNYYIQSNTNPYTVSSSISNNTLYIYANNPGSAIIKVCSTDNYGACDSININVTNRIVNQSWHRFFRQPFNFFHHKIRWW